MTSFLVSACSVACTHFRAALAGLLKLLGKPMLPTYGFISVGRGHRWSGRKRNFCAAQLFTHWPVLQGSLKGVSLMSRMHENYCSTFAIVHTRLTANKKRYNFSRLLSPLESALKTCVQKNTHKGVKKTCENGSNKTSENESIGCCQVKTSLTMPQMRWTSQAEQLRRGAVAWRLRSVPKSLRRSCAPLDAIAKVWCEKTKLYFHNLSLLNTIVLSILNPGLFESNHQNQHSSGGESAFQKENRSVASC